MESVFSGQARADGDASKTERKKREAQNDTHVIESNENILDKYSPYLIISMLVNHKLGCPRSSYTF